MLINKVEISTVNWHAETFNFILNNKVESLCVPVYKFPVHLDVNLQSSHVTSSSNLL